MREIIKEMRFRDAVILPPAVMEVGQLERHHRLIGLGDDDGETAPGDVFEDHRGRRAARDDVEVGLFNEMHGDLVAVLVELQRLFRGAWPVGKILGRLFSRLHGADHALDAQPLQSQEHGDDGLLGGAVHTQPARAHDVDGGRVKVGRRGRQAVVERHAIRAYLVATLFPIKVEIGGGILAGGGFHDRGADLDVFGVVELHGFLK